MPSYNLTIKINIQNLNQNVDPEKQKLKDDLNVALIRSQKNEIIIVR